MTSLANKVAIVTGASRGIGAAIARRLAADGARVVINYARDAAAADRVAGQVREAGGTAIAVRADLADLNEIARLFDAATAAFGQLDVLVNNAAIAEASRPLATIDAEHYQRHFDLNVRAALFCAQHAARRMGDDGGRIVNISSGITRSATPGAAVYSATKSALEMITRVLARELGPQRITVNCVSPGLTDTDLLRTAMPAEAIKALISQTPLGRLGTPQDVADVVAFLASDQARWVTGEVLGATGGL